MHSRASNEEALICLRAPERAVAFRSIYGLLWALGDKTGQAQRGGHSTPDKVKGKARRGTNAETKLGGRQSQMGDKLGDKTADKPSEADTAPQPR